MGDYIERMAALNVNFKIPTRFCESKLTTARKAVQEYANEIAKIPAAEVRPVVRAKWEDVHIDRPEIADLEVASMFCPNCNRWHNEVYHYGNPTEFANYCCFCGADMRGES